MKTGPSKQIYIFVEDYLKLKAVAKSLGMGFSKPRDIIKVIVNDYVKKEKINEAN